MANANATWLGARGDGPQPRTGRRAPRRSRPGHRAAATQRRKVFTVPGRLVRTGRRRHLRLPDSWPWADAISTRPGHDHRAPAALLRTTPAPTTRTRRSRQTGRASTTRIDPTPQADQAAQLPLTIRRAVHPGLDTFPGDSARPARRGSAAAACWVAPQPTTALASWPSAIGPGPCGSSTA